MADQKQNSKRNRQVVAVLAVIAALVSFQVWLEGRKNGMLAGEPDCGSRFAAITAAETLVRKQLKAPSTAKFPGMFDEQPIASVIGQCRHRVTSYVDAENGFGAMLRMNYRADIEYSRSTEMWTLIDLQLQ